MRPVIWAIGHEYDSLSVGDPVDRRDEGARGGEVSAKGSPGEGTAPSSSPLRLPEQRTVHVEVIGPRRALSGLERPDSVLRHHRTVVYGKGHHHFRCSCGYVSPGIVSAARAWTWPCPIEELLVESRIRLARLHGQ